MKKKGFTLIEMMAVLIILAILSMILIPLINDIISSSRKKAFRETVNNILESSRIYETGYVMDNGEELEYPVIITCDGEACEDTNGNKISFKGPVPISGRIILESAELMRAEVISNGQYCGSGTKGDIEVHEYCSMLDHTNPIISDPMTSNVSVSSTTNSVVVSIPEGLMFDEETGIERYDISIYEGAIKLETKVYEEPSIVFRNLKNNTEYKIEITGINGNRLKTTIERNVTTLDIINPTISYINEPTVPVNDYFKSQTLNVSFNKGDVENPEYYLRSGRSAVLSENYIAACGSMDDPSDCENVEGNSLLANTWYKVSGNINVVYSETASTETNLTALVYDGVNYGGADTKTVSKIDAASPNVSVTVAGTIATIVKSDAYTGVSAYCVLTTNNSNDCTWIANTAEEATYTAPEAGTYYVFVKDGVGNVSSSVNFVTAQSSYCSFTINQPITFNYTGSMQKLDIPESCPGVYRLEVWGAKGGTGWDMTGKNGDYAYGTINVTSATTLYIGVGGMGGSGSSVEYRTIAGGWNGGGSGRDTSWEGAYHNHTGGGGGATHIGKTNTLYGNTTQTNLYLSAAGGVGGYCHSYCCGSHDHGYGTNGGGSTYIGGVTESGTTSQSNGGNGVAKITYIGATVTITFDANGGSVNETQRIIPTNSTIGEMPIPTNANGDYFYGWYFDSTLTDFVTPETKILNNVKLYAKWGKDLTFDYVGKTVGIRIPETGTYKLEVWGAKGGTGWDMTGKNGNYATGTVTLTEGTNIYITVGSAGGSGSTVGYVTIPGGFNGGGNGYDTDWEGAYHNHTGGGGGATHISKTSTLIGNTTQANLYISAAGGVGGYCHSYCCGSHDHSYGTNGGGSNYIGGVSNGTITAESRSGNGLAKLTKQ